MMHERSRTKHEEGRVARAARSRFGRRAGEPWPAGPGIWIVPVDLGPAVGLREVVARPGSGRVAFEGR